MEARRSCKMMRVALRVCGCVAFFGCSGGKLGVCEHKSPSSRRGAQARAYLAAQMRAVGSTDPLDGRIDMLASMLHACDVPQIVARTRMSTNMR